MRTGYLCAALTAAAIAFGACGEDQNLIDVRTVKRPDVIVDPPPANPSSPPTPANVDMVQQAVAEGMRSCYASPEQQPGEAAVQNEPYGVSPNQCLVLNPNGRWPNLSLWGAVWYDATTMNDSIEWVSIYVPGGTCRGVKLYYSINYQDGTQWNLWSCRPPGQGMLYYAQLLPYAGSIKTWAADCPYYPNCPAVPSDW